MCLPADADGGSAAGPHSIETFFPQSELNTTNNPCWRPQTLRKRLQRIEDLLVCGPPPVIHIDG